MIYRTTRFLPALCACTFKIIYITFLGLFFSVSLCAQTTIVVQDFDGATPTWSYSSDVPFFDNGTDGFFGPKSPFTPLEYANLMGTVLYENDLDDEGDNGTSGFANVTFVDVNVASYSSIVLSFDYDIEGYNANDDEAHYEIFLDGVGQGQVTLQDGEDPGDDAEGTVSEIIPNGTTTVGLVISLRNNGASGYSAYDNFKLEGVATGGGPEVLFALAADDVDETAGTASVCVNLLNPGIADVSVDVVVVGGSATDPDDYTYTTQTVTFLNGDPTPQCVTVTIVDDTFIDEGETIELALQNVVGGTIGSTDMTILTIIDNDKLTCTEPAWNVVSPIDNEEWSPISGGFNANGFCGGGCLQDVETWLIYGPLDMTGVGLLELEFTASEGFGITDLDVQYTSESGANACPGEVTWTSVGLVTTSGDYSFDLSAAAGTEVYIGIEYSDDGANGYSNWDLINFALLADLCPTVGTFITPEVDAGLDMVLCGLQDVMLNATGDGVWSGGAGSFNDENSPSAVYTPDVNEEGTTVTLTYTLNLTSCTGFSDDVNIVFFEETADAEFSYGAINICPGDGILPVMHTTGIDGLYTVTMGDEMMIDLDPLNGDINLANTSDGTYEITNTVAGFGNLMITGVLDGPLFGGQPKAVEFYTLADIPDLSIYGFGSANNGNGTDGEEYTFDAIAVPANTFIYIAEVSTDFEIFMGFPPNDSDSGAAINGDDAIELFCNGLVIDLFGDIDASGSGQPWEYTDGWAYRIDNSGPSGSGFNLAEWFFSGPNALDNEVTNATAMTPFPNGTFNTSSTGICPNETFSVNITIDDTEFPVVDCSPDIHINLGPGECETIVDFPIPTATDNCPGEISIIQMDGPVPGETLNKDESPYSVSYNITDANGNLVVCSFEIDVFEFPFPLTTLTCNDGLNVSMGPDCQVEVNADMMLEGGPYGCYDDYVITIAGLTGTIITNHGVYEVTVTDPDTGNSCWGTITVEDKLAPQLDCPCAPGGSVVTEFSGTLETTDAFDPELAFNPGPGCFTFNQGQGPLYYDTYTFAIIDESATQPTCDFAFEVMDAGGLDTYVYLYEGSFNPNDICENLIALDDDGGVGLFSLLNTSQSPSNVNEYVFVVTSTGFGGAPVTGDYTIAITPGDPNCEILLLNNPDCNFSCTELTAVLDGYMNVPEPTVTGGCSGFNVAYTDYVSSGPVCGQQILQRVWYVTDNTGAITDQCVSEYVFNPVTFGELSLPPILIELPCGSGTNPSDLEAYFDNPLTVDIATNTDYPLEVIENNEGIPFAYPHYFSLGWDGNLHAQAIDNNVCNIYAAYSDQDIPACGDGCDGNTKVIRTWTLLDWCTAATTDYVQIIKSIDQEAPTFVATDVFASVEVHSCVAHIELPAPWELHDNCDENPWYSISGPAGVSITGNYTDGYVALNVPKGVHTFTYAAHDCCGNVGTQDITVTVADNTAPVPVATQNIVVSLTTSGDGQGIAKLYASSVDNGSHDSCSDVYVEIRRDSDNCNVGGNTTYNADGHPQDGNPLVDTDGGQFVKFCCADLTEVDGNNVPFGIHKVWMRVWDDGDMDGFYGSAGDNYNEIWVDVRVEDKLAPAIICPADVTIECDQDHTDTDLTGVAVAYGTCDGLAVDYTDTDFLNACNEGFVQRRWFIAGNPFGTFCIQRITIERNDPPFDGVITWPLDMTVNCTDADPGEPTWVAGPCDVVGYDVDSDTFLFEDGACFKILNEYTVIDWCQYEPNSPFWNGEGIWTHTQIIKIVDNVPPEITCEDAMYAVNDNDDVDGDGNLCENKAVMLTNSAVDGGGDCMSEWLKWQIEVDVWGDNTVDYVFSSFVPPFSPFYVAPTGSNEEVKVTIPEDIESSMSNHKVYWQVTDGCGNNAGCDNTFMVVDKKAPTPYCVSLSSALMDESGQVELWAIDFNIGSFDNCTEQDDLRYTFTSTAPENDPSYDEDRRSSSMVFDCDDLPQVTVNMYVWDEKGNSDFCVVTLTLVDNFEVCSTPGGRDIAGKIETEVGDGVEEVEVTLTSILPESPVSEMTVAAGDFMFADNTVGIDYSVEPGKDGDYMNGVSTLDLVLIQRHILNLELFTSPYKVIAADINSDEKVSAADLVQLRKLILGVDTELADNTSWRFVDATQTFEEVTSPWPFIEVIDIATLNSDMMDNDFIAAKIGDVNGSATANFTDQTTEVRSNKVLTLTAAEQTITAGQEVTVEINSADFADVYGYQFTIELNGLAYNGVNAGAVAMTDGNIGVLKSNLITVSYSDITAVTAGSEEGIFTMNFTADKSGQLSDMMKITSRATQAEAYVTESLEIQNVAFNVTSEDGTAVYDSYVLNQNEPNPFKDVTTISFYAPEDASATITVFDITGKVVAIRDIDATKGYNETQFSKAELGVSGILHYTLVSGDFTATKKMIVIE